MKIVILSNPTAGRGKARRALAKAVGVLRQSGLKPEVRESRSKEHLLELASQAKEERPDLIVCAGGDGTFHHILNVLVNAGIPLGLLPVGSGNDFAQSLGISSDPGAAARALVENRPRPIDLARVGSQVYASVAGVGFDSVVAEYARDHVRWLHGSPVYVWSTLQCIRAYRAQPLELRSEVKNFSGEVMFAVVGNGVSYGGGLKITPHAQLDDALLDVCIVPKMSKLELLRWFPRVYQGKHLSHPRVIYFQARKIELSSSSRLALFGDGEFVQYLPATVEVVPRAMQIVIPTRPGKAEGVLTDAEAARAAGVWSA